MAGRLWLETFTDDPNGGDYDTVSKFDSDGNLLWYANPWRQDGSGWLSVAEGSAGDLILVGELYSYGANLEYPGQFECSEQEPCSRELRNARNDYAILYDGSGAVGYYLVRFDANGQEK